MRGKLNVPHGQERRRLQGELRALQGLKGLQFSQGFLISLLPQAPF